MTGSEVDRAPEEASDVSVFAVLAVLLARWRLLTGIPVAVTALVAGISLALPVAFTATTTFTPESGGETAPGSLGGFAAQVLGVSGGENSAAFYADIVTSRGVLNATLQTRLPDHRGAGGDSVPLLDILGIEGATPEARLAAGRSRLGEMMRVAVDNETQILSVSVEAPQARLAADIANSLLVFVDRFNQETRRTRGAQRRRFIEERLTAEGAALTLAEDSLRVWLQRNREYHQSSQLAFEFDRLNRQVRLKEEVVMTLQRQYEEARIQEVNDTPLVTVIDAAVPPQERSRPKRKLMTILAFMLATTVSTVTVFLTELLARARTRSPGDYDAMRARWRQAKADASSWPRRPRS